MAEQEKREREQQNLIKKAKPTPDKIDPYATAPPQSPPRPKGGSATIGFSAAAKRKRILRRSLILRLGNSKSEPEIELSKPRDFQHVSHLEGESVNNSIFSVLELLCNPANDSNSSSPNNNSNSNLSPTSTPFLSASMSNVRFGSLSSLPPPPDPPTSPPASSRKSPKGKTSSPRTKRQKRPKRKKSVTQGARELPPLDLYQTANGKNDPKKEDQKEEAKQEASTTSSEEVKVNEVEDSTPQPPPQQSQQPSTSGEEVEVESSSSADATTTTTSTTPALADGEVTPRKEERPQLGRIASLRSFWEQIPTQSPEKPPEPKLDGSGGVPKVEDVAVVPPLVKDAISKIEEKEKLRVVPSPRGAGGTPRSPSAGARTLTPRSIDRKSTRLNSSHT